MPKDHEFGTRHRLLRVLLALVENPFGYTKQQLADRFHVSTDTIKGDFAAMRNAGFLVWSDGQYRYGLKDNKEYKQLKDLLHFSEEDQFLLYQAIDDIAGHSKTGDRLKRKLASLYDYHKLGHAYLRKPYLTKVDQLLEAREQKKQVVLKGYRSTSSNNVSDRLVEPFHPSPPDDILQAYDVDIGCLRHFRISRITRVDMTEQEWRYENLHKVEAADPFRIVDDEQRMVHLRLRVGAYNELIERFPLTKAYIEESSVPDVYDFQCKVNHKFYGLTNFLLGHHYQVVEIVSPDELVDHLRREIKRINF